MLRKAALSLAMLTAMLVAADFYGLFGYSETQKRDFLHITFEFIDAQSHAPLANVHVACTQPHVRSACSETPGPGAGQTTITLSVIRRVQRSVLFHRNTEYLLGAAGSMTFTFIPTSHERTTLTINNDDPLLYSQLPRRVELAKLP
jgi:hypothetical protein